MNKLFMGHQPPIFTSPARLRQQETPPNPLPGDSVDRASNFSWPQHPAQVFEERAGRAIECGFNVIGMLISLAGCGAAGAIAGALSGSLVGPAGAAVGLVAGGVTGAIGGGIAYAQGYGEVLGKGAMAVASVAVGALLGSLGGPTGTVVGAGLGAAYAAAGLYFSRD